MNPHHALAEIHRAELYEQAGTRRLAHDTGTSPARRPLCDRVGVLLVEAGLHLITRSPHDARGRAPRHPSDRSLTRAHQASNSANASGRATGPQRLPCTARAWRVSSVCSGSPAAH